MDIILVINAGSTSLKYKIFNNVDLSLLKEGGFSIESTGKERIKEEKKIFLELQQTAHGLGKVKAVGHRVVHGGNEFYKPTVVTSAILTKLAQYNKLAPLHNPYNLGYIKLALKYFSTAKNIAIFDTAFFHDLPLEAQVFPLPYKYFEKGIRRFGFHGLSHQYISEEAAHELGKSINQCNLITLHLGGGASVAAIKNGKPIDTTLGFTPMGGVPMFTRSGDIDPGVLIYLCENYHLSIKNLSEMLNRDSGLKGISEQKGFLQLLEGVERHDPQSELAFNVFARGLKKQIGAYLAILGNIDALVFSGTVGSGKPITRETVLKDLKLPKGTKVLVIPTNEELEMARQIKKLLSK
ncbi:MAG TPA: acetate/propionate family kinase [Candidatus Paceibacterota bacterium]|nr:acetate/propionate family kinase [Candidatus Paceibacterota bacterium]